jgi:hypothetical protein
MLCPKANLRADVKPIWEILIGFNLGDFIMTNLSNIANDIHFENDYGKEPIALAKFIQTPAELAIGYGVAGFIGFISTGFPALAYVGFIAGNDLVWAKSYNRGKAESWKASQTQELLRLLEEGERDNAVQNPEALTVTRLEGERNTLTQPAKPVVTNAQTCYQTILNSPYASRAIFGYQRTGKTYLAALASRAIGCPVFHVNLLSVGPEDGQYWSHAAQSVCIDLLTCSESDAKAKIKAAIAVVDQFVRHSGNALLVIDEVTFIGFKPNRYADDLAPLLDRIADQIAAFSSAGIKRGKALWTIAPEFVATTLTDQIKAVKKLPLCYVSIEKGRTIGWEGNAIGFSTETFNQIANNFTIEPPPASLGCDRIAYINGMWMPLGEMPSLPPAQSIPDSPQQLIQQWDSAHPSEVFARAALATFVPEVEAIVTEAQDFTEWFPGDPAMHSFIDWLSTRKESSSEITDRQIQSSYWAKKYGRDRSNIDRIVDQAIEYGFLIPTNSEVYDIGTW